MVTSAQFLIIVSLIAIVWLSLWYAINALTKELRQINGDPALRDRDIAFNATLECVNSAMDDPIARARAELERRP